MRRRDVYRGKRTGNRRLPALLLSIAVFFLVAAAVVFYTLPGYLVYEKDGVRLELPFMAEEGTPAQGAEQTSRPASSSQPADAGNVVAQLEVVAPDYARLDTGAGEKLELMQAVYVPLGRVTQEGLDNAVIAAREYGISTLLLEMKKEDGILAWASSVGMAVSYGVNGTWDPTQAVQALKDDGWILAARISCCADETMAVRNSPEALKGQGGYLYTDKVSRGWLDPWSLTARKYTEDLAAELLRMGFDEVILDHVEHPDAEVLYSREMSGTMSRSAGVSGFAVAVREALKDTLEQTGGRLSAVMRESAITSAEPANGQLLNVFLKVFDRIYVETDNYSFLAPLIDAAGADSAKRLVPIMNWTFEGGSWALKFYTEE